MTVIECYTDGSCPGNGTTDATGGLGFSKQQPGQTYSSLAIPWNEFFTERYGEPTNQKCELLAGMFPLIACMVLSEGEKSITDAYNGAVQGLWDDTGKILCNWRIHSDSKYVVDGVNHWLNGWKANKWKNSKKKPIANLQMWKDMDALLSYGHNRGVFSFFYVPGHSGNQGNDSADEAAVLAATGATAQEARALGVLLMAFYEEAWGEYMQLLALANNC
ncbi:ribonuclease H family protein [bacterium]|nr:ribonuclease H family protein [bacterium]